MSSAATATVVASVAQFRNYCPESAALRTLATKCEAVDGIVREVRIALSLVVQARTPPAKGAPAVAPKRVDADLKRHLEPRTRRLAKATQKAVELLAKQLQEQQQQ